MGICFFGDGTEADAAAEARLCEDLALKATLAELRAYWDGLRRAGALPRRQDIQPRGMAGVLSGAFLVERTAPGVGRLRVAGQLLGDLLGMDAAGMPLSALFDPMSRTRLGTLLDICLLRPATLEMAFTCEAGPGQPALRGRLSILPIASDGSRGEMGLGVLALAGAVGRAPRHLQPIGARTSRIELPRYRRLTSFEEFAAPAMLPQQPAPGRAQVGRRAYPHLRLVDQQG